MQAIRIAKISGQLATYPSNPRANREHNEMVSWAILELHDSNFAQAVCRASEVNHLKYTIRLAMQGKSSN